MELATPTPLVNIEKAADYLTVSERTLRRLVAERRIRYIKMGRSVRFNVKDLDDYINGSGVDALTV